jgi:hypothetical protein
VIAIMNKTREADGSAIRGVCVRRLPSGDDMGVQLSQHRFRRPGSDTRRRATRPTDYGWHHTRGASIAAGASNHSP